MDKKEGKYTTEERITIAEVTDLRVRQIALDEGQCVPWHYHSKISDIFFCMEGPMQVVTRNPDAVKFLMPGETFSVPPGKAHYVSGVDKHHCKFMIVQGVGQYDYIPVSD